MSIDPEVASVFKECGLGEDAAWKHKQSSKWIATHKALEIVAAFKGISYEPPIVLVAEKDAAAILVTGTLDGRSEWSIGEAVVGLNYRVSGNQAGYPFAMAEKRAKDRVILKLVGLHGYVYSEEEADEFKQPQSQPETPNQPDPFSPSPPTEEEVTAKYQNALTAIDNAATHAELGKVRAEMVDPIWEHLSGTEKNNINKAGEKKVAEFRGKAA